MLYIRAFEKRAVDMLRFMDRNCPSVCISPATQISLAVFAVVFVMVFSMLVGHMVVFSEFGDIADSSFRPSWGYPQQVMGGMHSLGKRDIGTVSEIKVFNDEEVSMWLPRDFGGIQRASPPLNTASAVQDTAVNTRCITNLDVGSSLLSSPPISHSKKSESVNVVQYDTPTERYHPSVWAAHVEKELGHEFGEDATKMGMAKVDIHVPLLQPLWGTLYHILRKDTDVSDSIPTLRDAPMLPRATNNKCAPNRVLVVLPSRWTTRSPIGSFSLRTPRSISITIAAVVAEQLQLAGSNALGGHTVVSFAIPILLDGGGKSFINEMQSTSTPFTSTFYWGLLGLNHDDDFRRLVAAALPTESASPDVKLARPFHHRVVRVQPRSATHQESYWCEEVTVSIPVVLDATFGESKRSFNIAFSVTELVCRGADVPGISNSLAAAVHIGSILGNLAASTHLVVLSEDHLVHTLSEKADIAVFRGSLQSSVGMLSSGFLRQLLSPWKDTCFGPHASQAIVLRSITPANITTLALSPISNLVVDHHGITFAFKALQIPSIPSRHTSNSGLDAEGNKADDCDDSQTYCIRIDTLVNSAFHPFSSLEGIVPVRRRHRLPGRSRRALGVLGEAETRDTLKVEPSGRADIGMIDAISPSAACFLATSFQKVNGYFGQSITRTTTAPLEDVVGALRNRIVLALKHMRIHHTHACTSGQFHGVDVIDASVRILRVVSRQIIGPTHAASEEHVIGWELSRGLSQLPLRQGESESGRPTRSEFFRTHAPLVASSGRVVRVPQVLTNSVGEEALRSSLSPRFVHVGIEGESHGNLKSIAAADTLTMAQQAVAALRSLISGMPTAVCVPDGLLSAVTAHQEVLLGFSQDTQPNSKSSLQSLINQELHPWRGAVCERDADRPLCVANGFMTHVDHMLKCDGMGEWLRRVSVDFDILHFRDISTHDDLSKWSGSENKDATEDEEPSVVEEGGFIHESLSQSIALFNALCQRWHCLRGNSTVYLRESQGANAHSDVPGAYVDYTRAVGLELNGGMTTTPAAVVSFAKGILNTQAPAVFGTHINQTIESYLWTCDGEVCPSPIFHNITQPLTLWQQWFVRYVRLLLQTRASQVTVTAPVAPTVSIPLSGYGQLFQNWSSFAWGAKRARSELSIQFALARYLPSSEGGSGGRGDAVSKLIASRSAKEASTNMQAALLLIGPSELAPLLRKPLLMEGASSTQYWCVTGRLIANQMPLSRAVVKHLVGKSWYMGLDSMIDLLDHTDATRLDCAIRSLEMLEEMTSDGSERRVEKLVQLRLPPTANLSDTVWLFGNIINTLGCSLPKSMATSIVSIASTLKSTNMVHSACDALYFHLQHIVYREALRIVDTTGILTLEATKISKTKECIQEINIMTNTTFLPGEQVLWRIPCFGCSGFGKETSAYLPPLIEDKGLPFTTSVEDASLCFCGHSDRGESSQQPQNMFARSRSLVCDNRCLPFLKSGTTRTLGGKERGRSITSGELYGRRTGANVLNFQRQRYFREPTPLEINIYIDSMNADLLSLSDLEVAGFIGADLPVSLHTTLDPQRHTPIDTAVSASLFSTYKVLGTINGSGGVALPRRRTYRICRAMYEADRISMSWTQSYRNYCDEIWVPGNWVRRMFVNSFVTPYMDVEFAATDPNSHSTQPCLERADLAPSTGPYKALIFDVEYALQQGSFGIDHSLENLAKLLSDEKSWAHDWVNRRSQSGKINRKSFRTTSRMSRLLFSTARMAFAGLRDGRPMTMLENENGALTQEQAALRMSAPVEDALRGGLVRLIPTSSCTFNESCRRQFIIGNASHVLSFHLKFKSSFDLSKIVAIPEAIDVHTMDPTLTDPFDRSRTDVGTPLPRPGLFQPGDETYTWDRWCSRKCFKGPPGQQRFLFHNESFRFFSVFKWEPRKGWRELLESYYKAFYTPLYNNSDQGEPMLIVLGSSYSPRAQTFESIFLSQRVNQLAQRRRWPIRSKRTGNVDFNPKGDESYAGRSDFPCMCFLSEPVSEEAITTLYRSMDAFVVTTRGEGWGLPGSEAMAMGLPIISTNWGGSTEFMSLGSMPTSKYKVMQEIPNSYGINVSVTEMPSLSEGYGGEKNMKMAAVSLEHAVELLRTVHSQGPKLNRAVGKRARDVLVNHFSQEATTDIMAARLAAVAQSLRGETSEEYDAAEGRQKTRLLSGRLI